MKASIGGIELSVDLREHWTGVRDQGARQSCLACVASDAHAHAHKLGHPLSAEYLFCQSAKSMPGGDGSGGLTFDAADAALQSEGQPHESDWPYQKTTPDPWTPPAPSKLWFGKFNEQGTDARAVFDAVRSGVPVVVGVRLVDGFMRVQAAPHIVDSTGKDAGGHAVLAVGIGRRPESQDDDLLLVRNSWGFGWGFGGHAWLPIDYFADKLVGFRALIPLIAP